MGSHGTHSRTGGAGTAGSTHTALFLLIRESSRGTEGAPGVVWGPMFTTSVKFHFHLKG